MTTSSTEIQINENVMEVSLTYKAVKDAPMNCPADSPDAVVGYMQGAFDENPQQEKCFVILMDTKHKPIARHCVTTGTATASLLHPREVFRAAIMACAASIVVVHNHPSGDPAPSKADLDITRRLADSARIIGITLADHVIIGHPKADPTMRGRFSFAEAGLI